MDSFTKSENLYRLVVNHPNFFIANEGRISSAVFKDSKGCSVDRQKNRDEEEACAFLSENHQDNPNGIKAIAVVTVEQCQNENAIIIPKPIETNLYHSEIHRDDSTPMLTSRQAKHLSQCARIVFPPFKTNK